MPATYEPIATTTLNTSASSITLSSIPGTYTDLRLVMVHKTTANYPGARFRINSDSSTLYSSTWVSGNGSATESLRQGGEDHLLLSASYDSAQFIITTVDFFNYAGSTHKGMLTEIAQDYNGYGYTYRMAQLYRSTSAITSLYFYTTTEAFATGTTVTLYGILKA